MNDLFMHFRLDRVDDDLVRYLFLRASREAGHAHLVRRELKRAVPLSALPTRARNLRTVDVSPAFHAFCEVDDSLLLVESWKTSSWISVSSHDRDVAVALAEELRAAVPALGSPGKVDVAFTDACSGSRYVELDARPWSGVRDNYPTEVRRALDSLVGHEPEADEARRLLLWHGPPGTGKTTAIRALLDAWREWADGVVVTDPEKLLNEGKYLRRTVLDNEEEDRWQLIVLEDAETLLHKGSGGRGMATLLNLCDGLLGQGLRCLFLITTNEPLDRVHPALVRPGRCLSRIEFGPLPAEQASRILGRPVLTSMSLAEALAIAPTTAARELEAVGQYL